MSEEKVFLRYASPNERRTLSREDLGHYHAVIIAAIYNIDPSFNLSHTADNSDHYTKLIFGPLRECIKEHPFLSVVVADKHTEKPYYQRVASFDLRQHINWREPESVSNKSSSWTKDVENLLRQDLDRPFKEGIPPWRVVILELSSDSKSHRRYCIAFEYSHTIGDGPSGIAFHKTFYSAFTKALSPTSASGSQVAEPWGAIPFPLNEKPFPEPFDTPERLRISWGFLLGPLLAAILPGFIANLLGLKAQASSTDEGTWTGTPCFFDQSKGAQSKAVVVLIPPEDVERALKEARANAAKLTGVIHQLVVRALSRALGPQLAFNLDNGPKEKGITNFVSTTAINMRRAVGVSADEMGEFASGVYITYPALSPTLSEDQPTKELTWYEWACAREATLKFADAATRLDDQPIGLLRYVPNIPKWIQGKLGKGRDASYEVSNLGVVDFENEDGSAETGGKTEARAGVTLENMVFAQPGHVTSHTVNFNTVSTKTGGMVVSITWPTGSWGLETGEEGEESLVRSVGEELVRGFKLF
ncbi:Alcohol acetyltransferase [Naviculisporaceae sp. PSN 640]